MPNIYSTHYKFADTSQTGGTQYRNTWRYDAHDSSWVDMAAEVSNDYARGRIVSSNELCNNRYIRLVYKIRIEPDAGKAVNSFTLNFRLNGNSNRRKYKFWVGLYGTDPTLTNPPVLTSKPATGYEALPDGYLSAGMYGDGSETLFVNRFYPITFNNLNVTQAGDYYLWVVSTYDGGEGFL